MQAFDVYAKTYDQHFTNSLIGKAQRKQVHKELSKVIKERIRTVLEINCGTGEDALWLATKGITVLATDISAGMLDVAKTKTQNNFVQFRQLKSQDIEQLSPTKYDLIFSNFGGLNCLTPNELIEFKNSCAALQNPENKLVFVIMGTNCMWECFYYRFKKENLKSKRRKNKNGVETLINGVTFKTYYYSPNEIIDVFKDNYRYMETKPIGLFVPPSYLETYIKKNKLFFNILKFLDSIFGRFSFLSNYADHYLIVLEKK